VKNGKPLQTTRLQWFSFFIQRTKKLRDGTSPICARVTVNGSRTEFRLQSSIKDKLWDHKNGCAKGKTKEAHEINEQGLG